MNIDFIHFTPAASAAGGLLVGLGVALFLLASGRVLGVSGIVGGLLRPKRGDAGWRLSFLAGLLCAPWLWRLFAPMPPMRFEAGAAQLVVAGLLVGWGTSEGSGCTSGHGVCGLSRLSPRSMVATAAFMATGFATVFVLRHVVG
jgi:uncharacterized membrane protein YedE/YeeE